MSITTYHTQFFDIIQIDLGVAHSDAEVDVAGNVIAVAAASGTCHVKFNSKSAPAVEINQLGALDFGDLPVAFSKLYITNTAQAGASITLITSNVAKLSVAPQFRGVVQDYSVKPGAWLTTLPVTKGDWLSTLPVTPGAWLTSVPDHGIYAVQHEYATGIQRTLTAGGSETWGRYAVGNNSKIRVAARYDPYVSAGLEVELQWLQVAGGTEYVTYVNTQSSSTGNVYLGVDAKTPYFKVVVTNTDSSTHTYNIYIAGVGI